MQDRWQPKFSGIVFPTENCCSPAAARRKAASRTRPRAPEAQPESASTPPRRPRPLPELGLPYKMRPEYAIRTFMPAWRVSARVYAGCVLCSGQFDRTRLQSLVTSAPYTRAVRIYDQLWVLLGAPPRAGLGPNSRPQTRELGPSTARPLPEQRRPRPEQSRAEPEQPRPRRGARPEPPRRRSEHARGHGRVRYAVGKGARGPSMRLVAAACGQRAAHACGARSVASLVQDERFGIHLALMENESPAPKTVA